MAIADDFSVAVNGDIRYTGTTANYTVLELHRFLQDLADDASASGNDLIDITSDTPSERSTDNIITLLGTYNIDDTAAEHLYAGSITQDDGDTVYSGLQVLGAVNNANTQLMIIQDNELYQFTTTPSAPFWGDQSSGGYNGNTAAGILMRVLIKSRVNGADINGKRIRVQARHWGDSYDFFNVTLGQGESVAAIGTTPDAQNDTSQGTVTAYTHVTNTEGFQTIDLNNGSGAREYYSRWTYGADTSGDGLKGMWEFIKDLTGNGTAKTIHGINGELFLGITHSFAYDNEASGPFQEDEVVVWGTDITYDTLSGGTFSAGDYVTIGTNGAAGRVMYDNGSTNMIVALEDPTITIADNDVITVADGTGAVTAAVDTTILNNANNGGSGLLLALDDDGTTGNMYIQLQTGSAPVDDLPVRGLTSSATADVNGAPTARTVPKTFLGSYTGSLIGAYGIGVDPDDLRASDSLEDLSGTAQIPPNNVTFTVTGLVEAEDRVLVGPRAAGILQKDQDTINGTLTDNVSTTITTTSSIPVDTPASGIVRVQDDNGVYAPQAYTSYTGSVYTLSGAYQGSDDADATTGNNIFIAYIDEIADATTTATFTTIYNNGLGDRALFVRVRDGGSTPIKTFEAPSTLTSTGGTIAAIRTSDA
jgi:hypothetical protein